MPYRSARFAFAGALRDNRKITSENAVDADFPINRLIDQRVKVKMRFASSESDHELRIDRGPGTLRELTRIYFPAGHNISGQFRVQDDTNQSFPAAVTILTDTFPSELGAAKQADLTIVTTKRHLRILFDSTGLWEIPEIVISETRSLNRGPDLTTSTEIQINKTIDIVRADGVAVRIELGGPRRRFAFTSHNLLEADITLLNELIDAVGSNLPFLLDPPSGAADPDTAAPTRWVKLVEDIGVTWSGPNIGRAQQTVTVIVEDHIPGQF